MLFERLKRSESLPPGHVEKRKAREAIDREYESCRKLEKAFIKKLPKKLKRYRYLLDKRLIRRLINHMCNGVGTQTVRALWWKSPDVIAGAGAHYIYSTQEIHFRWRAVYLTTVVHETAHHIQRLEGYRCNHGEDFCMLEEMLFPLAKEFLLRDWEAKNFCFA
jgi:hypothetical protein